MALITICLALSVYYLKTTETSIELSREQIEFSKCTDGDTAHFIIDGKDTTVRFLAIDTPETKHPEKDVQKYGTEASEFTCDAISNAKTIRLEYEADNKVDKYDRTLAWVFVDEQLLQSMLLEQGLAQIAYVYDDYEYLSQLKRVELEAKNAKLGIWESQSWK